MQTILLNKNCQKFHWFKFVAKKPKQWEYHSQRVLTFHPQASWSPLLFQMHATGTWNIMYRRRTWVQALPWVEIYGQGRGNRSNITEGPVLKSFPIKQSWDFLFFRNSDRLASTFCLLVRRSQCSLAATFISTAEDPACKKLSFFRQVRELKIQRKNLGSALYIG